MLYYVTMTFEITNILNSIEKAYKNRLQNNTARFASNIYNNFAVPLPPTYRLTIKEACKFLYMKYNSKEITIGRSGSLEWGTGNVLNQDVNLYGSIIAGNTRINNRTECATTTLITPGSFFKDCEIFNSLLDGVIIEGGQFTKIIDSQINKGTVFFGGAKVRSSVIGERNEIGQIEIVRSTTGKLIKALHRGFLGDAELGDNINVSNFFGIMNSSHEGKKAKVKIGNNVFLGGRSAVISGENGITIGDDAIIAGGAVVLKDVPEGYIYISKDKMYPKDRSSEASN